MPRTALPLACSLLLVAVATAAPVPKLKPIPISPANADRVKVVAELETDVWRLVPGPAAGELTFVRWEKPVEVVDATTLKPLRTAVEGKAIHFAATANGDQIAWGDKGS